MRECPNCNYVDPPYWRNRLFDYEVDICKLQDLFSINLELWFKLIKEKRGTTITEGQYCYKVTRTDWVYRIWEPLFRVRGWSPQKYYDGSGSRASTLRKMNLKAYQSKQAYTSQWKDNNAT